MPKKIRSATLDAVYETARSLHEAGIMDAQTMAEFEKIKLKPVRDLTPQQIKRIRLREKVSQPVFALFLNVSPSTIKKWETGEKRPQGAALKLLNIVAKKGLQSLNC